MFRKKLRRRRGRPGKKAQKLPSTFHFDRGMIKFDRATGRGTCIR